MGNRHGVFSLLSKYIFNEMLFPLIFCVIGITIMFLGSTMFELTNLIVTKNVPVLTVVEILLYRLPELFVLTFPIATLFATIYALGRLAKDNEITIMRISGYGIHRLLLPVLVVGILVSALTYWTNEEVAPWTSHRYMNILREMMIKDVTPTIKENVVMKGPDERQFFVRQVDQKHQELYDIIIYEVQFEGKESSYPRVITAKKGRFDEDSWDLEDGTIHEFDEAGFIINEINFKDMSIPIGDGLEHFTKNQRTALEMSRGELSEEIEVFTKHGIKVDSWIVEYHRKLAQSFVPFIFVLIGFPLSIRNKKGWVIGVIFSLVITFAFIVVDSLFKSLGSAGMMDPFWAAWIPLMVFGVLGVVLLIREEFFFFG